jgi:hypothetical protein
MITGSCFAINLLNFNNFYHIKNSVMKKILSLVVLFIALNSFGQRKSPHDTVSTDNVSVTYGRPHKNDRDIFGGLEKFGSVWRVGADEATTITFNSEAKFGDVKIPAGTYTMFARLGENEWEIILNSQLKQWGAFSYEKNKDKDVATIKVPVKHLDDVVEQLTIRFDKKKSMIIEWDKTQVVVPLKF